MKISNHLQIQKLRKMVLKNQERCLNSQPLSRKRAYLNKQKCQQKIMKMDTQVAEVYNPNQISIPFIENSQKLMLHELENLNLKSNYRNQNKKTKQIDHVKTVIKQLHEKSNRQLKQKINEKSKKKFQNPNPNIIHSDHSPSSIDTTCIRNRFMSRRYARYSQLDQNHNSQQFIHGNAKRTRLNQISSSQSKRRASVRITKIKSNKSMIKVFNPFPTPMFQLP